eukprot:gene18210-24659_t
MQQLKISIYGDPHKVLLLVLKSTPGCFFITIDSELDAAPNPEPGGGGEYPTADFVQLDTNKANAALAAALTPTRITTQKNFAAFMIIMSTLSPNIQRGLAARTDVAAKATSKGDQHDEGLHQRHLHCTPEPSRCCLD